MKRIKAKAVVSALALGAITLGARGAGADAKIHGVNFMMKALIDETFCVSANTDTATEGRSVFLAKCTGAENQRWTYTDGSDGSSVVVGHLGMCLDIRNRRSGDNTPVQIWRCHYGNNQRFRVTPSGHIKEVQSGKCLTVSKTPADHGAVYIDECDEQVKQQTWRLVQ
jgi:hypothetical protein